MAFADPSTPNSADFLLFVREQGITTAYLPDASEYLTWALGYAQNVCMLPPPALVQSYVGATLSASPYVLAVYNLGFHRLLTIAQDQPGQTFFTEQRKAYSLLSFTAGPIQSSYDETTGESMVVPDWVKMLPIQSLSLLKTPWGRFYLEYAHMFGPELFGVS